MIPAATLTFSDSRTPETDEGGRVLGERLVAAGCTIVRHAIVREDVATVRAAFAGLFAGTDVSLVVSTGGTGISPRDHVPDVLETLLEKRLDGFGEAFRRLSWDQVAARSILSRALAGVVGAKLVVCLPGSVKAVRLGVDDVLAPLLPHAIDLLGGRTAHG